MHGAAATYVYTCCLCLCQAETRPQIWLWLLPLVSDDHARVQVLPLAEVAKLLDKGTPSGAASCGALHWPPHVYATHNFAHAISTSSKLAGYLRSPSTFLACPDGSLLLLSEREADRCAAVLRRAAAAAAAAAGAVSKGAPGAARAHSGVTAAQRPVLMHLAFARDACPPLASATPHPYADVRALSNAVHLNVALGVAALQLFGGETGLRRSHGRGYQRTSANQDALRKQLFRLLVLGPGFGVDRPKGYAQEQLEAAKAVAVARQQNELWSDSDLDRLCEEATWAEAARDQPRE